MTDVYDLSDPAHPKKIREFGLPGQQPGSSGAIPADLHGPLKVLQYSVEASFAAGVIVAGKLWMRWTTRKEERAEHVHEPEE